MPDDPIKKIRDKILANRERYLDNEKILSGRKKKEKTLIPDIIDEPDIPSGSPFDVELEEGVDFDTRDKIPKIDPSRVVDLRRDKSKNLDGAIPQQTSDEFLKGVEEDRKRIDLLREQFDVASLQTPGQNIGLTSEILQDVPDEIKKLASFPPVKAIVDAATRLQNINPTGEEIAEFNSIKQKDKPTQEELKKVKDLEDKMNVPLYRKVTESLLGGVSLGLNLLPPVMILNAASEPAMQLGGIVGESIGGETGKEIGETLGHIGLSATLGLPVLLGTLTSMGATEVTTKILEGTELGAKDKASIEEAAAHIGFLVGMGSARPLAKGIKSKVSKHSGKVYEQFRGFEEGALFKKKRGRKGNRVLTPDGKAHFKKIFEDPASAPAEKAFAQDMLEKNGIKIEDIVTPVKPKLIPEVITKQKPKVEKIEVIKPVEIKPEKPVTAIGRLKQLAPKKEVKLLEPGKPPVKKPIITPEPKAEVNKIKEIVEAEGLKYEGIQKSIQGDFVTYTESETGSTRMIPIKGFTKEKLLESVVQLRKDFKIEPPKKIIKKGEKPVEPKKIKVKKVQITGTKKQKIVDTKVKDITVREEDFQGRDEPFSGVTFRRIITSRLQQGLNEGTLTEKRIDKIISDANKYLTKNNPSAEKITADDITPENVFDWAEFGQVQLWRDPATNKLVVISGHSRLAASDFLQQHFNEFKDIPTSIREGITFEEAEKLAKQSNVLQTREKITSDAERFRKMRDKGASTRDIMKAAKSFHGRESTRIVNLSFLDRTGDTITALKAAPEDRALLQAADWIGGMRRSFDELTPAHENEMFKWLIKDNALGTKVKSKTQFLDLIDRRVNNITFDIDKPLNLKGATVKSRLVDEFERDVADLTQEFEEAKKDLFRERDRAFKRGVEKKDLDKDPKVKFAQGMVDRLQKELIDIKSKRDKVLEQEAKQTDLFTGEPDIGIIGEPQVSYNPLPGGRQRFPKSIPATETTKFKKWFGKSKITKDGEVGNEPLKMYHGTFSRDFTQFDPEAIKTTGGASKELIFFTPDADIASKFAFGISTPFDPAKVSIPGARLYEVYLKSDNPFKYHDPNHIFQIQDYFLNNRTINYIGIEFTIDKDNNTLINGITGKAEKRFDFDSLIDEISIGEWHVIESNSSAFKKAGFDGMWMNELQSETFAVFNPEQIKSTTSRDFKVGEPDITREKFEKYSINKKLSAQEAQVNSLAFKKWFGDSAVTNMDGSPLVVWHGTTHNINSFDVTKANQEGHFGKVVYFTNSEFDANRNYLETRADLTGRIANLTERIHDDFENNAEESIYWDDLSEEGAEVVKLGLESGNPLYKMEGIDDAVKKIAKKRLLGAGSNIIPVYLKLENPFIINAHLKSEGEYKEDKLDWGDIDDLEAASDANIIEMIADEKGIETDEVDLTGFKDWELDNYRREFAINNSYYIEPDGAMDNMLDTFKDVMNDHGLDGSKGRDDFQLELEKLGYVWEPGLEVPAHIVDASMRKVPELLDAFDASDVETGGSLLSEIIRETYERSGYDGIILTNADQQFPTMKMDPETTHFHIFKPEQVKSAIGNNGEFDPNSVDIIRENMEPFKRSTEGLSKNEIELQRLKDYRNHLVLVQKELANKEGNMILGRNRYGTEVISYSHRRAQVKKEISDLNTKIKKLDEKIPKVVKLENQVDMFGMDVKAPKTNDEFFEDLILQRDKINNAVGDALTSIDYWENEIKDPSVKKDKKLFEHAEDRLAENKLKLKDFNKQLQYVNRKLTDIDGGKALDERDLKDKLKDQHQDLKSKVEISRSEYDYILKKVDAAGLFADAELQGRLARAKEKHLSNVAALEAFLGKNTNLYDELDKPEDGKLFVSEQIELEFATRKVALSVGSNPSYKGTKFVSWAQNVKNLENPALRKLEPGETAKLETKYSKFNQLNFFGRKTKVESVEDVVFMFKQLETQNVEHAFFVHVDTKGKPTIQHISTGAISSTVIDPNIAVDLANRLNTEQIYFVHNHPSGNLDASQPDIKIMDKIRKAYENMNIIVHKGIIINIKEGRFSEFDMQGHITKGDLVKLMKGEIKSVKLPAITFSRNVFREQTVLNDLQLKSPDDVAVYLSKQRFGLGEKNQVLVLAADNKVIANLFLKTSMKNRNNALNEINSYVKRFGGARSLLVTNGETGAHLHSELTMFVTKAKEMGMDIMDIIAVEPQASVINFPDKKLAAESLIAGQSFNIGEPGSPYTRITPASQKVNEPGADDPRLDKDKPRLDKYVDQIEKDLPPVMEQDRLSRLNELERKTTLTPEEKAERTNLRKEKKGFAAKDPFLRRKLSTDIRRKIKNVKTGHRIGSQAAIKQLVELQADVTRYAKLFLPRGNFMKSEVTGLISAVTKSKDLETLTKAFAKIRTIEEKVRRRTILTSFNKLLTKADPTKGDPQFVTWIKKIRDMKPDEVEAEIERVLDESAGKGLDLTEAQDEYFYLLNKYSDIKNKSIDDLEALFLELQSEMEAGRSKRRDWLNREKERRQMLRENAIQVITGGGGVVSADEARVKGLDKEVSSAKDILSNLGTMSHSWEMILDKLSKFDKTTDPFGSWLNKKFAIDVHNARNREGSGVRKTMDLVRSKLMETYGIRNKRKLAEELNSNSTRRETGATRTKITERDAAGLPVQTEQIDLILSQNEAAHVLMAYEDPKLSRTFERMGFNLQTIEDLRKFVKPTVMKWANWQIGEFYPGYYGGVNEIYNSIRGVDLPFNDKYIPIRREVSANITDAEFLGDVTEFVSIINGSLLARVTNTRPLKIQDIDRVLLEHVVTMEHFKAFAPVMQDMRAVFNSEQVRNAIKQYHGTTMLRVINRFMNDFARGGVDRKNSIAFLDVLRSNFIRSVIGVNPVVTIKQLTSFPAFAMDIPTKDFIAGVVEFASNPIPKIKFLRNNSEMLQTRYSKGWERDIILAMQRARKTTAKELSKKFTFTDASMMFTKFGDASAIMFGGWSVYKHHKKLALKGGATPEEAHKKAMLEFEMSTKRAQQAGDVEDLGELQRQGSWQKMFTIFMTAPKQYFSNASAAYRNILYKRGSFTKNMKRLFIAHSLLPMLFQFSADGFRWNTDHMLRAAVLGSINGILILGDVLEFLFSAFQGDVFWEFDETPLGSMVGDTKQAVLKIKKFIDSNDIYLDEVLETLDAIADAASKPFGLPYMPVKKLTKGIMDFSKAPDEESFLRLFGYPKRVFEDVPDVDPMVEEIKKDEKRLIKLKATAREMPRIQGLVDEAKEFERVLKLKKKNSPEWIKYQKEQKQGQKDKRKNDPFAKPKAPKSRFGRKLFKPGRKKF